MMNKYEVPHAIVPGYHDFEADLNQFNIMNIEDDYPFSVTKFNRFKWYDRDLIH